MNTIVLLTALAAMGSEDYDSREWGSKAAARLVRRDVSVFGPAVNDAAAVNPSAEVQSRCKRISGGYRKWLADGYKPAGFTAWPRLDSATIDFERAWYWLGVSRETLGWDYSESWDWESNDDRHQRHATALFVRDEIACGRMSTYDADRFVASAWWGELAAWLNRQGW